MTDRVVVLTGGVGGAKLVLGLSKILPPESITAIVNTGDDFRHLGLPISPDIDTLLYTLSGKANAVQGWGREDESWSFLAALRSLGGPDWFALGDGDLALHVLRGFALGRGDTLSNITEKFAKSWNIGVTILPMSDNPVATMLSTDSGELDFQNYFVAKRCAPLVHSIRFEGADKARPGPFVLDAIATAKTILLAPSNPFLSINPILAVPGIARALTETRAPVVAVSPIIGGKAVKGPTAKLMQELGLAINPRTIAEHYKAIIDGLLVDKQDDAFDPGIQFAVTNTLMISLEDRVRVAQAAMDLARRLTAI